MGLECAQGGAVFVVTQLLLWTYFGAVVAGLLHVLASLVHGLASGRAISTLTWALACGMPSVPVLSALSVLSYVRSAPSTGAAGGAADAALPPLFVRCASASFVSDAM